MAYTTNTYNEFQLTGSSPVTFSYQVGGVQIYSGIGYARPGATKVYVRPADVFSQYLGQELPRMQDAVTSTANILRTFSIISGGYTHTYNYCFGDMSDTANTIHHEPITGRLEKGQYFIGTLFDSSTVIVTSGGNVTPAQVGNHVLSTSSLYGGLRMEVGTGKVSWTIVPKCHRYILYYVNSHGAWDSLVCEGAYKATDGYQRSETGVYPSANISEDVAQVSKVYLNEVTKTYVLNTGWLTDDEASRMHHLLGSCMVYLCDTDDGNAMYPVKITNADCPYKTFKNEGGAMVNYEIEVEQQVVITRR